MQQPKKLGTIVFIMDDKLSREKKALLTRTVNSLRQIAHVHLLRENVTEDGLLEILNTTPCHLVLAPWYRYFTWKRTEAFFGNTRTSGATFAGYFCEAFVATDLGTQCEYLRALLLDFAHALPSEILTIVKCLIQDQRRSGIRPLLEPGTSIYCENWYGGQGMGQRIDSILAIPEIANTEWHQRSTAIRIALYAMWSLIYENGPGKSEFAQAITAKSPKAYFQFGCDHHFLVFRLFYSMPSWTIMDVLTTFWPNTKHPTSANQLLMRYTDFLRIHTISETPDLEIVAAFTRSAPSEQAYSQMHNFWIEPIAASLFTEVPFEAPGPSSPHLKNFAPIATAAPEAKPRSAVSSTSDETTDRLVIDQKKDRFIVEATQHIRELKKLLLEREAIIQELKAGGVGAAQAPVSLPDAESLLEAFQERYFEGRFQIRQFEIQIMALEKKGGTASEIETLRQKMAALANREKSWIRKIAETLEVHRESLSKSKKPAGS